MRRARTQPVRPSRLLRALMAAEATPSAGPDGPPLDLTDASDVMRLAVAFLLDVHDLVSDLETGAIAPEAADAEGEALAWAAADLVEGLVPGALAVPAAPGLGARILKRARWEGPEETAAFRLLAGVASEWLPATLGVMRGQVASEEALGTMGRLCRRIVAVVLGVKEADLPPLPDPKGYG